MQPENKASREPADTRPLPVRCAHVRSLIEAASRQTTIAIHPSTAIEIEVVILSPEVLRRWAVLLASEAE